jgi:serine/threonine protein kinase
LASKYEVIDHLDDSPLGTSYRVKHLKSGKFVRITVLRPEVANADTKEELLAAFRRAKDLRHPHLVRLGEIGEHDDVVFVTWEDFDGRPLRELLQEYKIAGRKFGLKDAAQVVNQVLEALSILHEEGVVLRALRPENILVNARYAGPRQQNFVAHVKIVGACLFDLVPSGALVEDEYTRGQAQYLAPELKSFEPMATGRSDIYSAGVVFYEMLTGQAPVGTFLPPTQVRPELPKLVDDVVELAMANAPEDRYRNARDLVNGIQRVFEAAASEPAEETKTWPIVLGIAGIGGILIAAVSVILFFVLSADTDKSAMVDDQKVRAEVKAAHSLPSAAEREGVQAQHPKGMIYIPPGPFVSGRFNIDPFANKGAEPLHDIVELKGFLIDAFEYPNELNGTPTVRNTWADAQKTCESVGKRLCSSVEWEKACKGPRNNIYAYGNTFDPDFCGEDMPSTYQSGSLQECRSDWGVFDLSGGFKEWTSTPMPGDDSRRMVKGGSVSSPEKGTRCAYSTDESAGYTHPTLAFRCCRDVDAPPYTPPPEPEPVDSDAEATGG